MRRWLVLLAAAIVARSTTPIPPTPEPPTPAPLPDLLDNFTAAIAPAAYAAGQEVRVKVTAVYAGSPAEVIAVNTGSDYYRTFAVYLYNASLHTDGLSCNDYNTYATKIDTGPGGVETVGAVAAASEFFYTFRAPHSSQQFVVCFKARFEYSQQALVPDELERWRLLDFENATTPGVVQQAGVGGMCYVAPNPTSQQYAVIELLSTEEAWNFTYAPAATCGGGLYDEGNFSTCGAGDVFKVVPAGTSCSPERPLPDDATEYFGLQSVHDNGTWVAAYRNGMREGATAGGIGLFGTRTANPVIHRDGELANGGVYVPNGTVTLPDDSTGTVYHKQAYVYLRFPPAGNYDLCFSSLQQRAALRTLYNDSNAANNTHEVPLWRTVPVCRDSYDYADTTYKFPKPLTVEVETIGWSLFDFSPNSWGAMQFYTARGKPLRRAPANIGANPNGTGYDFFGPEEVRGITGELSSATGGDWFQIVNVADGVFDETTTSAAGKPLGTMPSKGCWTPFVDAPGNVFGAQPARNQTGGLANRGDTYPYGSTDLRGDPLLWAPQNDKNNVEQTFGTVWQGAPGTSWRVCYFLASRGWGVRMLPFSPLYTGRYAHLDTANADADAFTEAAVSGTFHPTHILKYSTATANVERYPPIHRRYEVRDTRYDSYAAVIVDASEEEGQISSTIGNAGYIDTAGWKANIEYLENTRGSVLRLVPSTQPCVHDDVANPVVTVREQVDGGLEECASSAAATAAECSGSNDDNPHVVAAFYIDLPSDTQSYRVCHRSAGWNWVELAPRMAGPGFVTDAGTGYRNVTFLTTTPSARATLTITSTERRGGVEGVFLVQDTARSIAIGPWPEPCVASANPNVTVVCPPQNSMLRLIPRYLEEGVLNTQCDINPSNWVAASVDTHLSAYCPGTADTPGIQLDPCKGVLKSVGNWTDELFAMVNRHASGVYRDITAVDVVEQMTVPIVAATVPLPVYNSTYLPGNQYSICFRDGALNWVRLPEVFVVEPGAAITMTRPLLSGTTGSSPLLAGTDMQFSAEFFKAEWVPYFEAKFVHVTGAANDNCLGYGDRTEAYPIMSIREYEYTELMELISFSLVTPATPGRYLLCLRVGDEGWFAPKAPGKDYSYDVVGNYISWWVEQGSVPTNQGQVSIFVTAYPGNINLNTDEVKIVAANASCLLDASVIPHETPLLGLSTLTSRAQVEISLPPTVGNTPVVYRVCVRKEFELPGQDPGFLWVEASQATAELARDASSGTSVAYPVRTTGGRPAFVTVAASVGLLRHNASVGPLHNGILTKPSMLPFFPALPSISIAMHSAPDVSAMRFKFVKRSEGGCGKAEAQLAEFEYIAQQQRVYVTTHLPAEPGAYIVCVQPTGASAWVWVYIEGGGDHMVVGESALFAEVRGTGVVGNRVMVYDLAEVTDGVSGAAWCGDAAAADPCAFQGHTRDYLLIAPNTSLCQFPPSPAEGIVGKNAWYYLSPDIVDAVEVSAADGVVLPPLGSNANKFRICVFKSRRSATAVEGVYQVPLLGTAEAFWSPQEADPRLVVTPTFNTSDPLPVLGAIGYRVRVDGDQELVVSTLRCFNTSCLEHAWPGEAGSFDLIDTAAIVETAQCEREGFGAATDGGLSKSLSTEGFVEFELRQRTPCPIDDTGRCALRFGTVLPSGRVVLSEVVRFAALPPSTVITRMEVAGKFMSSPHPLDAPCTPDLLTCHTISVVVGDEDPVVIRPQTEVRYAVENRYLVIDCVFDDDSGSIPLSFPRKVLLGREYVLKPQFTPLAEVEVRAVRCRLQVQDETLGGSVEDVVFGPITVNFLVNRQTLKRVEVTGLAPEDVDGNRTAGADGPLPTIASPFPSAVSEFHTSPLEHMIVRTWYVLGVNSIGLFNRAIISDFDVRDYEVKAYIAHPENHVEVKGFTTTGVTFQVHNSSGCSRKDGGCEVLFEWHRISGLGMPGFVTSVKLRAFVRTIGTSLRYHTPAGLVSTASRGVDVIVEAGIWCGEGCFIPDEFHVGDVFTYLRFPYSEDGLVATNGFRVLTTGDTLGYASHTLHPMKWHPDVGIHGARMRLHGSSACIGCEVTVHSTSGATLDPRSSQGSVVFTLNSGEDDLVCDLRTVSGAAGGRVEIVAVDSLTRRPALHPRWPLLVTTTTGLPEDPPATTTVYLGTGGRTFYPIRPGETVTVQTAAAGLTRVLRCDIYLEAPPAPSPQQLGAHDIVAPDAAPTPPDRPDTEGYLFTAAQQHLLGDGLSLFISDEGQPFNITSNTDADAVIAMFTVVASLPDGSAMERTSFVRLFRGVSVAMSLPSRYASTAPANYTFGSIALNFTHVEDVKAASVIRITGGSPVREAVFFICTDYNLETEACSKVALSVTVPKPAVSIALIGMPNATALVAGGSSIGCFPRPSYVELRVVAYYEPAEYPGRRYVAYDEEIEYSLDVQGEMIEAVQDYLGAGGVVDRPVFQRLADGTSRCRFSVLHATAGDVEFHVRGVRRVGGAPVEVVPARTMRRYTFGRSAQVPAVYRVRDAITEDLCNVDRPGPVSADGYRSTADNVVRGWNYAATGGVVGHPFPIQTVVDDVNGQRAWNVVGNKIRITVRDPGRCGVGLGISIGVYADGHSLALRDVVMPVLAMGMATPWVTFHSPCKDCRLEMAMCYSTASGPESCLHSPGDGDTHPALPNRIALTKTFSVRPAVPTLLHVVRQNIPEQRPMVPDPSTGATVRAVHVGEMFDVTLDTAVVLPPNQWSLSAPLHGRVEIRVVSEYTASASQQEDLSRGLNTGGFVRVATPNDSPLDAQRMFQCGERVVERFSEHSQVFNGPWTPENVPNVRFAYTRPCQRCRVRVDYRFDDGSGANPPVWRDWESLLVRDAQRDVFEYRVDTCGVRWGLGHATPPTVRVRQPFVLTVLRVDGNANPTHAGVETLEGLRVNALTPEAAAHTDYRVHRRVAEDPHRTVYAPNGVGILGITAERACYRCNITFDGFTHVFSVLAAPASLQATPTAGTALPRMYDGATGHGDPYLNWTMWRFEAYAADAALDLSLMAGGPTHKTMLAAHENLLREGLALQVQAMEGSHGPFGFMAKVEGRMRWRVVYADPIRLDLMQRAVVWNGVVYVDVADMTYMRNTTNMTEEEAVSAFEGLSRPNPAAAVWRPAPLEVVVVPGSAPGIAEVVFTANGAPMATTHGGRKIVVGATNPPNYLAAGLHQETVITGTQTVRIPLYLLSAFVSDNRFSRKEYFHRSMENTTALELREGPPPVLQFNKTCTGCSNDALDMHGTAMYFGEAHLVARSVGLKVECNCELSVGYEGIANTVKLYVKMLPHEDTAWEWVTPAEALIGDVMQSLRLTLKSGSIPMPPEGEKEVELRVRPDPAGCFECALGDNSACPGVIARLPDGERPGVSLHGTFRLPFNTTAATCGVLVVGLEGRAPGYEFSVTAGGASQPLAVGGAYGAISGAGGGAVEGVIAPGSGGGPPRPLAAPAIRFLQSATSSVLYEGTQGSSQTAVMGSAVLLAVSDAQLIASGFYDEANRTSVILDCGDSAAPALYFEQRAGREQTMVFRVAANSPGMYDCRFTLDDEALPAEYQLPSLIVVGRPQRVVISSYNFLKDTWALAYEHVLGVAPGEVQRASYDDGSVYEWVSGYTLTLRVEVYNQYGVKIETFAPVGQSSVVAVRSDRAPCLEDEALLLPYSCAAWGGQAYGDCSTPPASALRDHTCVDPWWGESRTYTRAPDYVPPPSGDTFVKLLHAVGDLRRGALQVSIPSVPGFLMPLDLVRPASLGLACSICQEMPPNAVGRTRFALLNTDVVLDVVVRDAHGRTVTADSVGAMLFRIRCLSPRYLGTMLLSRLRVPGTNATTLEDEAWDDGWYHVPLREGRARLSGIVFSGPCPNGLIEAKCNMDAHTAPGAPLVEDPRGVCGRLLVNESLQFGTADDLVNRATPTAAPLPVGSPFVILNVTGISGFDDFDNAEFEAKFSAELNKILPAEAAGTASVYVRYLCKLPDKGYITEQEKLQAAVCRYYASSQAARAYYDPVSEGQVPRRIGKILQVPTPPAGDVYQLEFVVIAGTTHRNVFSAVGTVLASPRTSALRAAYPGMSTSASLAFIPIDEQPTAQPPTAIPTPAPTLANDTDPLLPNETLIPFPGGGATEGAGRAPLSTAVSILAALAVVWFNLM